MHGLEIREDMLKLYNKKLDFLSQNIWEIVDNIDYYRYIRYIMLRIQIDEEISKWDAIKLYNFIIGLANDYIPRTELEERYREIEKKLFK